MAAFFADARAADRAVRLVPEADWRYFLARPFNRGGRDFAVALEGDRFAGLLMSTRIPAAGGSPDRRHFRIVVHPAFRRRGVGDALFRLVEAQDRGDPPEVLQCRVPSTWVEAARFLGKRGFRAVHTELEMERRGPPPPPAAPPPGVDIAPSIGEQDIDDLVRLHDEGCSGAFGVVAGSREAVLAERAARGALHLVARAGGAVAGFCKVHHEGATTGWVNDLVVGAAFRRRGVGRALLLRGLAALHEAGRDPVGLCVEKRNRPAVALYRSVGFVDGEAEVALWRGTGRGLSR